MKCESRGELHRASRSAGDLAVRLSEACDGEELSDVLDAAVLIGLRVMSHMEDPLLSDAELLSRYVAAWSAEETH